MREREGEKEEGLRGASFQSITTLMTSLAASPGGLNDGGGVSQGREGWRGECSEASTAHLAPIAPSLLS